jgi:hypothetical protein
MLVECRSASCHKRLLEVLFAWPAVDDKWFGEGFVCGDWRGRHDNAAETGRRWVEGIAGLGLAPIENPSVLEGTV